VIGTRPDTKLFQLLDQELETFPDTKSSFSGTKFFALVSDPSNFASCKSIYKQCPNFTRVNKIKKKIMNKIIKIVLFWV
jgi:hypothetical protein